MQIPYVIRYTATLCMLSTAVYMEYIAFLAIGCPTYPSTCFLEAHEPAMLVLGVGRIIAAALLDPRSAPLPWAKALMVRGLAEMRLVVSD